MKKKNKDTIYVTFQISKELYKKLGEFAQEQGCSINEQYEQILKEFIRKTEISQKNILKQTNDSFILNSTNTTNNTKKSLIDDSLTPQYLQNWMNERTDMTQEDLAKISNLDRSTLSRFLNDTEMKQVRKSTRRKLKIGMENIEKYEREQKEFDFVIHENTERYKRKQKESSSSHEHASKIIKNKSKNTLTHSQNKVKQYLTIYIEGRKRVVDSIELSKDASLLKPLRARARLTQQELSDATGIARASFPYYESGQRRMHLETATNLFDFLHQRIENLDQSR